MMMGLLAIEPLDKDTLLGLLDRADVLFSEDNAKRDTLAGKTVINLFMEPSTRTRTSVFVHRANTASVDQRYEALPPSVLDDSFVRFATAPLIPTPATLKNQASAGSPDHAR